jgi:hypothetical protein
MAATELRTTRTTREEEKGHALRLFTAVFETRIEKNNKGIKGIKGTYTAVIETRKRRINRTCIAKKEEMEKTERREIERTCNAVTERELHRGGK